MDEEIDEISNIEDVFKLLEASENVIRDKTFNKDLVLLLGNTGSGKSTFAKFIASDNTALKSIEVVPGSGEYIVEDDEKTIGHGIKSKTILPGLICDQQTNTYYVDCPGFGDTRNSAYDISAIYHIKNVVNNANDIKIVLTVPYFSVRVGMDRKDFMTLIKHMCEFITHIDNFKKSLVLLVTKVEDYHKSRDQIIQNVAYFLEKVKTEVEIYLKNTSLNYENRIFNQKALQIIDIFLTKNGDLHSKIMIFSKPKEAGRLSDLKSFQDEKKYIKNTLADYIVFTSKTEDDFDFTISAATENDIFKLVSKTNDEIARDIDKIMKAFIKAYEKQCISFETKGKENIAKISLEETIHDLENSSSINEFAMKLSNYVNDLNIQSFRNTFLRLTRRAKYIKFFEDVLHEKLGINVLQWTIPLRVVLKDIEETENWYNFLFSIYKEVPFTSFDLLRNRKEDIMREMPEKCTTMSNNIADLLKSCFPTSYIELSDRSGLKIKYLNDILHIVLSDLSFEYINANTLQVTGDFIKFSDVVNYFSSTTRKCDCIYIFALSTFYIDTDFKKPGFKLFIIAPTWEVVKKRQIILDGLPGASYTNSKAKQEVDGLPGLPGGSGGAFIGIGHTIINSKYLTVSACGGNGGPGQDGGSGRDGKDGKNSYPSGTLDNGKRIMEQNAGYKYLDTKNGLDLSEAPLYLAIFATMAVNKNTNLYVMHGKRGTKGTDGWKAGCGGMGGYAGQVSILGFPKNEIQVLTNNGENGQPGKRGKGGIGGRNDDEVLYEYVKKTGNFLFVVPMPFVNNEYWVKKDTFSQGRAENGIDNPHTTDKNIKHPENASTIENTAQIINKYKTYLCTNMDNKIKRFKLINFYEVLHESSDINQTYNTSDLHGELLNYEEIYCHCTDLKLFYESLSERLLEFAINSSKLSDTDKKILNYLITATLSKLNNMKDKYSSSVIVDVDKYIKYLLDNVKLCEKSCSDIIKSEYSLKYKEDVNQKIIEAVQFIKDHIDPEITKISTEIEQYISQMMSNIVEKKDEATQQQKLIKNNIVNLLKQKEVVKKCSWFSKILKVILSCGETFIFVAQNVSKVVVSLGVSAQNINNVLLKAASKFTTLLESGLNLTKNFVKDKCKIFLLVLDKIILNTSKFSDKLPNVAPLAKSIENEITNFIENIDKSDPSVVFSTIKDLFKVMSETLQMYIEKCNQNQFGTKLTPHIKQTLTTLTSFVNMGELFPDTFMKYKEDDLKLQEFGGLLYANENELNTLEQFEMLMLKKIQPMFSSILRDIHNLDGQSFASLNVANWKVRSALKDMSQMLSKMSRTYDMDSELLIVVDRLKEAVYTQADLYDRIQDYNEHKRLIDYLENLATEQPPAIATYGPDAKHAMAKLDFAIRSNMLLSQYEMALHNFKQFIFPFAPIYMKQFNIETNIKNSLLNSNPGKKETELTMEDIVADVSKKIKYLRIQLIEKHLLLNNEVDQCVFYENFSAASIGKPFYCWQNTKYKTSISSLLSGKEIVLMANILHGPSDKNAIKFNKIQLNLVCRSEKDNEILQSKLQHFDVTLTHYGNSYFRFDNNFYVISSGKVTFHYSFAKDEQQNPERENEVNRKMKDGNFILSPYATWGFQLKAMGVSNFETLKEFEDKVNLELIGYGQYVGMDHSITGEDLLQYYKPTELMSITDAMD